MTTNLDGAFLTIRECMASMHGADWGRVIGVSSIAGVRGLRGASAYTASKHGLIGLIRGLSEDYLGSPITFNALCPGYVDTPIVTRNITAISGRVGVSEDEALQKHGPRQSPQAPDRPIRGCGGRVVALQSGVGKRQWPVYRNRWRADVTPRTTRETV